MRASNHQLQQARRRTQLRSVVLGPSRWVAPYCGPVLLNVAVDRLHPDFPAVG